MLRSMTGFGKGLAENNKGIIKVELRSLNYKFFEVVSKLPAQLAIFEDNIREFLQRRISRGRLSLFLTYENLMAKENEAYLDKTIARKYYSMIQSLQRSLGLKNELSIGQMLLLPGVVAYRPQERNGTRLWPLIEKALSIAAADLIASKQREGHLLKRNLLHIIEAISRSLAKIKQRAPKVARAYKKRLKETSRELTGSARIANPGKLEEEAAIFARNCDISEETHRLSSHIAGFKKALENHDEIGRQLDFMAQEMHREINTLGAKANDFPISKQAIKIKSLIEKIREQVQNVE